MRQYHMGQPKEFWASASAVADVLQHTAPWDGVLAVSNFVHIPMFDGRVVAPGAAGWGHSEGRELTCLLCVCVLWGDKYSLCWSRWVRSASMDEWPAFTAWRE